MISIETRTTLSDEWYKLSVKGIPKSEAVIISYYNRNNVLIYIITRDKHKNYKLYYIHDLQATFSKHRSNNPTKLEEQFKKTGGK